MPSLIISQDVVTVNLQQQHLNLAKRTEDGGIIKQKVLLFDIDRVLICGRPTISLAVFQKIMLKGIPTFFLTSKGKWIGSISPDNNMNAKRRIKQYQLSTDKEFNLILAQKLIFAKIRNSRRVLQRLAANRDISHYRTHGICMDKMKTMALEAKNSKSAEHLRGFEGMAAALYFEQLGQYFPENVPFKTRSRRPPGDAANALLSWTYAIVQGEIDGAIRSHGLDSCIGCLHATSHGTPSLTLDLLEPLRAPLCDMTVLNILNHNILTDEDFEFHADDGGTYLKKEARYPFFNTYESAMTRTFIPYQEIEHTTFRKIIEKSVINILKAMEGNYDYEFFLMP